MSNHLLRAFVRSMFFFSSRKRAIGQAAGFLEKYNRLAEALHPEDGRCQVEVPPMPGVDEDMRNWSYYMILEHNTIVNRHISTVVDWLVAGKALDEAPAIDIKKDVMPSESPGEEQLRAFEASVADHIAMVRGLKRLRGTKTVPHVIFGPFDAHMWNCMFAFHLGLHYRQARYVVRSLTTVAN